MHIAPEEAQGVEKHVRLCIYSEYTACQLLHCHCKHWGWKTGLISMGGYNLRGLIILTKNMLKFCRKQINRLTWANMESLENDTWVRTAQRWCQCRQRSQQVWYVFQVDSIRLLVGAYRWFWRNKISADEDSIGVVLVGKAFLKETWRSSTAAFNLKFLVFEMKLQDCLVEIFSTGHHLMSESLSRETVS